MLSPELSDFLDLYRREINSALTAATENWYRVQSLEEAVRHALWGGKRLRPLLALMSAKAVASDIDLIRYVPITCALEMVHIFTLIHDDLPGMDNAKTRHGQVCTHLKFGEGVGILAGDALLNQAFGTIYSAPPFDLPIERRVAIASHIVRACATVVEGQVLDLQYEGRDVTLEELENLHLCKTAALLEASCLTGAELAGGDDEARRILREYANNIGLAYQVKDDLLSILGNEIEVGKTLAGDIEADKATYPKLLGVDGSIEFLNELTGKAIDSVKQFGNYATLLIDFAKYQSERTR